MSLDAEIDAAEIADLLFHMTPEERAELDALLEADRRAWRPLPGPQTMAYESEADIIGFGGAAGGGKTDLACGKALTRHSKSMFLRRVGTELTAIIDRLEELLQDRNGYNGKDNIWRRGGRQMEFGAVPNLGDEKKYQGRPHDLLVFDEAANFLVQQVRFLLGWLRTTDPDQHCQTLMCFNPPTTSEGQWIVEFFAPWLRKNHPNPAKPGELRWAASLPVDAVHPNGRDIWVDDARPFVLKDGEPCFDFDPTQFDPTDIITPMSRTFIPSRVTDNPYLTGTGYMATLQALPEPLRSQMLKGDFTAGMQDDPWQLIPTAWVEAAMDRWRMPDRLTPMSSMGIDVARGGKDNTIIARRHEPMWFDRPLVYPGSQTPDGPTVAGLTIAAQRDQAPMHIDVIGVGASPYDFLTNAKQQVTGVNVSERAVGTDKSGRLKFKNLRSQLGWMFREALDPANNVGLCLPPDDRLKADLCAFTWELQGSIIYVESREDIVKRIGRSPDWASAYFLALIDTPKRDFVMRHQRNAVLDHNPLGAMDGFHNDARRDYDPLAFSRG